MTRSMWRTVSASGVEPKTSASRPLDKAPVANVVYADNEFVEIPNLMELPLCEPPELLAGDPARLHGREEIAELITDQIASGRSAQLYGEPGVGKKSISLAVHKRLSARGVRGHLLLPRSSGDPYTLALVYKRLAVRFFGRKFLLAVDETVLRATLSGAEAHITLIDCPLSREDVSRLLKTFSSCTFLITSRHFTLPDPDGAHHVEPLSRADAINLLSADLGLSVGPVGLQNLQFDHAYRLAEGRPQQLRLYAEFIRSSDQWRVRAAEEPSDQPALIDPDLIGPPEQAQVLAAFVSEPARRVLVALKSLGVPLASSWLPAVTGDPRAAEACQELRDRRLVTRDGDRYQITDDAASAVGTYGWDFIAKAAAEGVLALVDNPQVPAPDPDMLLSIASELDADHAWATAARFGKIAVPIALAAGREQAALQLCTLGKRAAGLGTMAQDLKHYVHTEECVRLFLPGNDIAVATAETSARGEQSAHKALSTRPGSRLLQGNTRIVTATVSVVAVTAAIAGIAIAAAGPGSPKSNGLAACVSQTKLEEDLTDIQADWINGDDAGSSNTPIPALLNQSKALDLAGAAAATSSQGRAAYAALLSGIEAFGNAYNAGADYGNSVSTFSGAAASAAEDALGKAMDRLPPACDENG